LSNIMVFLLSSPLLFVFSILKILIFFFFPGECRRPLKPSSLLILTLQCRHLELPPSFQNRWESRLFHAFFPLPFKRYYAVIPTSSTRGLPWIRVSPAFLKFAFSHRRFKVLLPFVTTITTLYSTICVPRSIGC